MIHQYRLPYIVIFNQPYAALRDFPLEGYVGPMQHRNEDLERRLLEAEHDKKRVVGELAGARRKLREQAEAAVSSFAIHMLSDAEAADALVTERESRLESMLREKEKEVTMAIRINSYHTWTYVL